MSDDSVVETVDKVDAPDKNTLENMTAGYVVGIDDKGHFIFEVVGKDLGLIELMGLHEYAAHRIKVALEMNQGYGVPLLAGMLEKALAQLKVLVNMNTEQAKSRLNGLIKS